MINHKSFALKCRYGHAFSVESGEAINQEFESLQPRKNGDTIRVCKRRFVVCPFCEEKVYAKDEYSETLLSSFDNQSDADLFIYNLKSNEV